MVGTKYLVEGTNAIPVSIDTCQAPQQRRLISGWKRMTQPTWARPVCSATKTSISPNVFWPKLVKRSLPFNLMTIGLDLPQRNPWFYPKTISTSWKEGFFCGAQIPRCKEHSGLRQWVPSISMRDFDSSLTITVPFRWPGL